MTSQYPSNVELHRWAETQPWGHKVLSNAVTKDLIKAWDRAHPDRPYVKSEAFHGTPNGYGFHDCRCEPCTAAASSRTVGEYHSRAFERGATTTRRNGGAS